MIVLVGHGIDVASVALPTRNVNADGMYANSSHVFTPINVNSTSGRKEGNDRTGIAKGMADVLGNTRYQLHRVGKDCNQG